MKATQKEKHIQQLFSQIKTKKIVPIQEFRKCLTHISVYEAKNDLKSVGNSRYVFLGMYAFRGYLAELINQYITGNGKQLQHYLGNVFSNERLSKIFDELELQSIISLHTGIDVNKVKHIFAQALTGYIYLYATDTYKQAFAFRYFLNDSTHLLPKTHRLNQVQVLKVKAQQVMNERISIRYSQLITEQGILYVTKILLSSGEIIGEHQSISQTYSRKKALKNAIHWVLDKEVQTDEYQLFAEKKRIEETEKVLREKAERQKQNEDLNNQKREKRAIVRAEKKAAAKEREYRRVLNKKQAKKKGEKVSEKEQILKELENPNINPSKRRFLEDKLK